MGKPDLKWSEKEEDEDFEAAFKYLSLLRPDSKAHALVKSLRGSKLIEHAAKDLLRAAQLPLLPRDEPHVDQDLKRIQKGKALAPVLLVRGDMGTGSPSLSPMVITAFARSSISMRARPFAAESPTSEEALGLRNWSRLVRMKSSSRGAQRRGDPGVVRRPTFPWIASLRSQ